MATLTLTVLGLPLHPLIVHATVVAVPAAALAAALAAVWPRFREWLGWGTPAIAAAALVLVPITTSSGESLEHALPGNALIRAHTQLGDQMVPWSIAVFVLATLGWWMRGLAPRAVPRPELPPAAFVAVTVLTVLASLGALVWVVLIGHSGATAAWSGVG